MTAVSDLNPVAKTHRVYVDEAEMPFRGMLMAHMFSPDITALHAMAEKLGVRQWFQDPLTMPVSWPHYDISSVLRARAIEFGAVPVDRYQMLVMAKYITGKEQQQKDYPPIANALKWLAREIGN